MSRHHARTLLLSLALAMLPYAPAAAGGGIRQPIGIKGDLAELFDDSALRRSRDEYIEEKEEAGIRALAEELQAVEVRCGNKHGWVARQDLEYGKPSPEKCRNGGGSVRNSNECP